MMLKKFPLLLVFLLTLSLIGGYAGADAGADAKSQLQFHILAAELAGQRGDAKTAAREYYEAIQLSPDANLAERATRVAVFAEEDELALDSARIWLQHAPQSIEARELALGLSLSLDEDDEAEEYARGYLALTPKGKADGFRQLARIIGSEQAVARAGLPILEDLAQKNYEVPEASYAVALVSLRLDEESRALEALDRALTLKPGWNDAILLKTSALIKANKLTAAERTMVTATGTPEERAAMRLTYARLLLEAGLEVDARRQFEEVVKLAPGQTEALNALALMSLQAGNKEAARRYFESLYDRDPDRRDDAAFYLGTLAEDRGEQDDAVLWYARVVRGAHQFQALQRRVFLLGKMGRMPQARRLLSRYLQKHPGQAAQVALTEGGLLFEYGQYDESLKVYTGALQTAPNEPELLYGRALVFERQGRVASAEQDLRRLLEVDGDDPRALNALGYILSNHSGRYDEARKYIERAYKQNPEDPAVNDSLGWVYFRLGKPEKGLAHLRTAYQQLPDPEVAAHLGEVLWTLGERQEAQNVWRLALDTDPSNPILRETVDRLLR